MPRLMAVSMTVDAVIERRKTVTRRLGWLFVKPGDRLVLCRKVQGRKRRDGTVEPLDRLALVEVVTVRREPLEWLLPLRTVPPHARWPYARDEMTREGFPGMDPRHFVEEYFVKAQGVAPDALVTRIEWRYLDEPAQGAS